MNLIDEQGIPFYTKQINLKKINQAKIPIKISILQKKKKIIKKNENYLIWVFFYSFLMGKYFERNSKKYRNFLSLKKNEC
jgi:hypothetical protein